MNLLSLVTIFLAFFVQQIFGSPADLTECEIREPKITLCEYFNAEPDNIKKNQACRWRVSFIGRGNCGSLPSVDLEDPYVVLTFDLVSQNKTKLIASKKIVHSVFDVTVQLYRTSYFFDVTSEMAEKNLYWNVWYDQKLAYEKWIKFPRNSSPMNYKHGETKKLKFLFMGNLDFDEEGLKTFDIIKQKYSVQENSD